MIRRPPRSTPLYSSAASDVYKRQHLLRGRHLGRDRAGHLRPLVRLPAPGAEPRLQPGEVTMAAQTLPGPPPQVGDHPAVRPSRSTRRRQAHAVGERPSPLSTTVLLVGAVYCLLPVVWVLIASTKSAAELFATFTFAPSTHLFDNVADLSAYRGGLYWRWMANTALYAGVGGLLSVIVSGAAGYGLAKYSFAGKKAIFNTLLAGVLVPGVVLAIPQYLLLAQVGLTNTYWSVLLPSMMYGSMKLFQIATNWNRN